MGNGGRWGCSCGSEAYSEWEFDAQGIELCRCCDDCRDERLAQYRPEILSGYTPEDMDEPLEGD